VPVDNPGQNSGLFAFEEKVASRIDSVVEELSARIIEGESIASELRAITDEEISSAAQLADLKARLEEKTAELDEAAAIDPLTGLYSRAEINRRIRQEKNRADRGVPVGQAGFALLLIDIDGFREINSEYGLAAGDRLLKRFGSFIKSSVRSYDVIGRFGGDEFIVLLPGAAKEQAGRIAVELIGKIAGWKDFRRETAKLAGKPAKDAESLALSCCVGISDYLSEGRKSVRNADPVTTRAEYALYRARRSGRGKYAFWGDAKEHDDD
jgi:diguanylate cyclase (GGDEF)-like protein